MSLTIRGEVTRPWPAVVRAAARDLLPALVPLVPFAVVVGATAQQTGAGQLGGLGGGMAMYSGTAQLSAMTLLAGGASVLAVVVSVAAINARLLLYAASLERHFVGQPTWFRWLGPHFIVDQTFMVVTARDDLDDAECFRRYWLASAGVLTSVWLASIAVGLVMGARLPGSGAVLAFAPVALFVPALVPRLVDRASATAAVAATTATAAAHLSGSLPAGTPVLVGAVAGTVAAVVVGRGAS